ncbi:MAG TPA: cytochrome P450 [Polyangiaceae bacterium]
MTKPSQDWDPTAADVLSNQVAAYDEMRLRCPVAHSELLGWSLFRHEDVARVIADTETFSNVVSTHRSVPNGMDPPEHTAYRQAIEPYLGTEKVRNFEPECRVIATELLAPLASGVQIDFMDAFAVPFAVRCQCAFLGWPEALGAPVREWTRRNRDAVLTADRAMLAEIAREFETFIVGLLDERRRHAGDVAGDDLTTELMRVQVNGKPLTDAELTSIFRNWTVGEVGSMAAAVGILAGQIARAPELQRTLREVPALIPAAIEELLRVDGPLVSNRRRVTREVTLGGHRIAAGERVSLMWISANRDETVFEGPDSARIDRDQRPSLLWGAGVHVCPGAGLARLEMRVALEALLSTFDQIVPGDASPRRLAFPENGWASLPLRLG